jgi:hypothetical protein
MVYINYPRTDMDQHAGLVAWRGKNPKNVGDWTDLKLFLAESSLYAIAEDPIPKCWYTELPQGDNYALDVEHFRPKNDARPLSIKHLQIINKRLGYNLEQNNGNHAYPWLEFDYRNYRLTSALPNRGGAKHVYFPVAAHSTRLNDPEVPWTTDEYNLLLDPTDPHDAEQLLVFANGSIIPRAQRTMLSPADFLNYQQLWHGNGFNYLRATISIVIYRLEEKYLQDGREKAYSKATKLVDRFFKYYESNLDESFLDELIEDIVKMALPSSPFSLAVRSALNAYIEPAGSHLALTVKVRKMIKAILQRVSDESLKYPVDWSKP